MSLGLTHPLHVAVVIWVGRKQLWLWKRSLFLPWHWWLAVLIVRLYWYCTVVQVQDVERGEGTAIVVAVQNDRWNTHLGQFYTELVVKIKFVPAGFAADIIFHFHEFMVHFKYENNKNPPLNKNLLRTVRYSTRLPYGTGS